MDVEVSLSVLVIAAVGSLVGIVLGVALMRLCYISSRRGYDDDVGKDCRVPPSSGSDAPGGIGGPISDVLPQAGARPAGEPYGRRPSVREPERR